MDREVYDKYMEAGRIAAEARDLGVSLIKPGVRILDVVEKVEGHILFRGAGLSFPVNISINEVAAHFTPLKDDKQVFRRGDIVKLDVGSHIDGYIADTAVTVEVETNRYKDMIEASASALDNAIENMKLGVRLSDIGRIIEKTINSYGYTPIENLTGHSLDRYILHSGMSIPNVSSIKSNRKPKIDDVIAIEPFATDGIGHVISGKGSNIYIVRRSIGKIRDKQTKFLFQQIKTKFKSLPFAHRWCNKLSSYNEVSLSRLNYLGFISQYPQLIEQTKGIVTQKEHTVIVTENGCEVTTYGEKEG
ncbi:MAG: type II methionyl aminopeptidase [Thermoplasmata archaeon]|nr:MAG: type II methionyl aminopeptidase [Thermoplasmata archaeon]